jgi:diguanylate cyclase (GGDEF)-like protein
MLRKQRVETRPLNIWQPLVAVILWSGLCVFGGLLVASLNARWVEEMALEDARAVVQTIVDFWDWNTTHDGVYVPVDDTTPPNPFLAENLRTMKSMDGRTFALVNHAYMTRQVGEISRRVNGPSIRVTSRKPVRPENAPLPWEAKALQAIEEQGLKEYQEFGQGQDRQPQYRYAAPLITQTSCLECHVKEYRVGDVRGAVTVVLASDKYLSLQASFRGATYWLGALAWVLGLLVIMLFDRAARARHRTLEQLKELTLRDPLTGLHNRRGFIIRAEQALETLARERGTAVLAFADLDRLKELNDVHGHQEGDLALEAISRALASTFRNSDVVARIGGDEFAILLVDAAWDFHDVLQKRVESAVAQANKGRAGKDPLSLSVGMVPVNLTEGKKPDIQELLGAADEKMYQVKARRRG